MHLWALVLFAVGSVACIGGNSAAQEAAPQVVREDFLEVDAHIPVVDEDLSSDFLILRRLGPGAGRLKLSFHPHVEDDPHYIWNGECQKPVLIGFDFRHELDLSSADTEMRLRTKNSGASRAHLALRVGKRWFVRADGIEKDADWSVHRWVIAEGEWRELDARRVVIGAACEGPDLSAVAGVGIACPVPSKSSPDCVRLDWFELCSSSAAILDAPATKVDPFFSPMTRGQRTALVVDGGRCAPNRTRRGVLVHAGDDVWACFDPDLLRWAAVWRAPPGQPPISMDSMAAVSYPKRNAKAERAPLLRGTLITDSSELPGVRMGPQPDREDPRTARLTGGEDRVGPLPRSYGRWLGLSVRTQRPALRYAVGGCEITEVVHYADGRLVRRLTLQPHDEPVALRIDPAQLESRRGPTLGQLDTPARLRLEHLSYVSAPGLQSAEGLGTFAVVPASPTEQSITIALSASIEAEARPVGNVAGMAFPPLRLAQPRRQAGLAVREGCFERYAIPIAGLSSGSRRAIRPTDLAFAKSQSGVVTAYVATLDGDIWDVTWRATEEGYHASWERKAAGLFEPLGIETGPDGVLYVLGRDQVTALRQPNDRGDFEFYACASDAFWQTLHTRDYAASFALDPADGSFLVAKGGIMASARTHAERSEHRGSILRLPADGGAAQVLADGLRLPFVGLRDDGAVFASDQQGHHTPSSPVHHIGEGRPYMGFEPMRSRKDQQVTPPLLWYPYQTNRSAAGFATLDPRAFPSLGGLFVHISWNGRLFGVESPERGQAFSWRLPLQLDIPALNATTHPETGELYVVGLGISGYLPTTPKHSGITVLRETHPLLRPMALEVDARRVKVDFAKPLQAGQKIEVGSLRLWNLKRSASYGSGHYRWDGSPGEHLLEPQRVTLSDDRRSLLLTMPQMYRSDVLALKLLVTDSAADAPSYPLEIFARPRRLAPINDTEAALMKDAKPAPAALFKGNALRGAALFRSSCIVCHSVAGQAQVGPALNGIATRRGGEGAKALRSFLLKSIVDPNSELTPGYPAAMPTFEGAIGPEGLEDLVTYLATLK